ncbi:MAG: hypothetical protein H6819_09285 [Phycisphaerales bacterium]|nr:hypothetical protein [Phycisphaerales bacterium]MCB9855456.1 hypothetical protein [Phycisphaerales bacterium]MCB9864232.1 hypothetical protein [Phycisphaerales bacterium]
MISGCLRLIAAMIGISVLFVACDGKSSGGGAPSADSSGEQSSALPTSMFVETAPANAIGVRKLKERGASSGEVVVRGRIGGRARPFVDGAAVFVLTDAALKSCDQLHGDSCKTPWDYCCETPESMAANTATIQIVDENGKPIRESAEGRHGLMPLAKIVVRGEIASRSKDGNLVINARKIAIVPG